MATVVPDMRAWQAPQNRGVVQILGLATAALLTLPFAALFAVRHFLSDSPNALVWAAVAAAVVVQGVLVTVIFLTVREENRDARSAPASTSPSMPASTSASSVPTSTSKKTQ